MNKRLLIIDDDEELCMELKEILGDEGYEVHVAMDGFKATALIERDQYAVIILDLKLPKMNGYQVLETVKRRAPNLKVIVLSGRPMGETALNNTADPEVEKSLQFADAVMNKPVLIPVLVKEIKKYA